MHENFILTEWLNNACPYPRVLLTGASALVPLLSKCQGRATQLRRLATQLGPQGSPRAPSSCHAQRLLRQQRRQKAPGPWVGRPGGVLQMETVGSRCSRKVVRKLLPEFENFLDDGLELMEG